MFIRQPENDIILSMKSARKLFLAAAFFILTAGTSFADFAAGAQFSLDTELFPDKEARAGVSATCRSDWSPWCFALSAFAHRKEIAVAADNWFVNESLSPVFSWYALWGISAGCGFDSFSAGTGARLGLGLDCLLLSKKQLELYCQLVWNPYFGIEDDNGLGFFLCPLVFPFAAGARWWLR